MNRWRDSMLICWFSQSLDHVHITQIERKTDIQQWHLFLFILRLLSFFSLVELYCIIQSI